MSTIPLKTIQFPDLPDTYVAAQPIIAEASGAIASFTDGADDLPVEDLTVSIVPKQAGSGTPSPSNVRAISGFTEANIVVSPTQDAQDGTTYTDSFGSAGTVYGGTLNVTTGKLTVEWFVILCDGSTETWAGAGTGTSGQQRWNITLNGNPFPVPVGGAANAICSHMAYNSATYSAYGNFRVGGSVANRYLICGDSGMQFANLAAWKAMVTQQYNNGTPITFAYKMAEGVEYNLTPAEVRTLLGANNIWADSGDVSVWYVADTKMYIDKKIAELQALVLES